MLRAANGSFGSETGLQLLLQDASGLNIEAAIDGFVGHACLFASQDLCLCNHPAICCGDHCCLSLAATTFANEAMPSQLAPFGPVRAIPSGLVC